MIVRFVICLICLWVVQVSGSSVDIENERGRVVELFHHGFSSYMENAFPYDELAPLSCTGKNTIGNYSLTLIDSLDMLAILGEIDQFEYHVRYLQNDKFSFNLDVNVSTFETNIRILGGLLSSHLLAEDLLVIIIFIFMFIRC